MGPRMELVPPCHFLWKCWLAITLLCFGIWWVSQNNDEVVSAVAL